MTNSFNSLSDYEYHKLHYGVYEQPDMEGKFVYLTSDWLHNVGNGFIDIGGQNIISTVTDEDPAVVSASSRDLLVGDPLISKIADILPEIFVNRIGPKLTGISDDLLPYLYENPASEKDLRNTFDILNSLSSEYKNVVFSGMRLTRSSLTRLTPVLSKFIDDRDGNVILLGAGGSSYSDREVQFVRNWLKKIEPYIFVARDKIAYEKYCDLAEHSYNGIDCAFFLEDDMTNLKFDDNEYIVHNFDRSDPTIANNHKNEEIVRTHHVVADIPNRYLDTQNLFLSSYLKDYLEIYANAKEVYTDRLHTCIPSLVYGTPCQYTWEAQKNILFESVNIDYDSSKIINPQPKKIEKAKTKQLEFLSSVL